MGIQGLHKGLAFATRRTTLRDFRGQRLAIDSSSWLHRSVYSISEQYVEAMEAGQIDSRSVQVSARYLTHRCRELLNAFEMSQIIFVMDGKRCPLKADTNGERERRRQQNLHDARAFRRRGLNRQAEEKYKTCIKIKDAFTAEVMKQVEHNFRSDSRVRLVWSPYEADAQLAKLCMDGDADAVITEDSDVLVYSAATHCPFPVIFKLDRRSGNCDVISMDWLLNYRDTPTIAGEKQVSALEALLRNLASRQARRPGFGVRLFVQGCVLAGCDYAPNKLIGVGLVNAFKYIRDCAFRHDSVRFARVLESMPRKHKAEIEASHYELNLAKSEAVFFYHLVKYRDGSIKPLCGEPKLADVVNNEDEIFHCSHFPSMERFSDDWTFLGETPDHKKLLPSTNDENSAKPPIAEITIQQPKPSRISTAPLFFAPKLNKPTQNPYLKRSQTHPTRKRSREGTEPLSEIESNDMRSLSSSLCSRNRFSSSSRSEKYSSNSTSTPSAQNSNNMFSGFAHRISKKESNKTIRMSPDPLMDGEDTRFAKRDFATNGLQQLESRAKWFNQPSVYKQTTFDSHESETSNLSGGQVVTPHVGQYSKHGTVPTAVQEPQHDIPTFYDLTDVNSPTAELADDGFEDSRPARVSLDPADFSVAPSGMSQSEAIDLAEPQYDFQYTNQPTNETANELNLHPLGNYDSSKITGCAEDELVDEETPNRPLASTRSRFFGALPSSTSTDRSTPRQILTHGEINLTNSSTSMSKQKDEIIDSPDSTTQIGGQIPRDSSPMARPKPVELARARFNRKPWSKGEGTLHTAFARQRDFASSSSSSRTSSVSSQTLRSGRSWVKTMPKLSSRRTSRRGAAVQRQSSLITSFLVPNARRVGTAQLELNPNQTDEEFLWKTP